MPGEQAYSSEQFEDFRTLIKELRSQQQFTDKLNEECAQKAASLSKGLNALDGSNNVIDDHPKSFNIVLNFYKEHFAKLKFNYLEQETKDRFLKSLLKDPSVVIEQADNWELDRQNSEEKQKLKAGKLETSTLQREIATVGKTLNDAITDLKHKVDKTESVFAEINEMEAELTKMSQEADKHSKLTVEEAKTIIDHQTEAFQNISNEMEKRRDAISELSWKIENLEHEIEQLEAQKFTAEAYAADAVRMANKRDPTVEDLTKWYLSIVAICNNLYGLQDIQIISKTEILAIFNVKHPAIPDDNKIFHLNVFLNPVSGAVEDAESIDNEVEIQDIVDIAKRLERQNSLTYLLQSVGARIRS
ncbi:hypothetical protein BGW37DRAFT_208685 [Umbelopsis sp. PMI_123]|nr:hypothetical protein BGW37DRAFT_208685 [Umbelopsis sp. PMI_123]